MSVKPRAVILAGGKGVRLRPFTASLPKPLVPLGDKPILEVVLRQLAASGFGRATLTLGHLSGLIRAFVTQQKSLCARLDIDFVDEEMPTGTAGSLANIEGLDDDFLVMNGDVLTNLDYLALLNQHRQSDAAITIGVLIAQDIAIVPMLIIAENLGHEAGISAWTLIPIVGSVAVLGALIWYLNKPGKLKLPFSDQMTGKPDLIALAMLAFCFGAGTLSSLIGLSPVYGAFIAGLIIANSTLRSEAIELTFPVQSILVFVFFLSIGLLIDLSFIAENWLVVAGFTIAAIAAKTALNIVLVHWTGYKWEVAFPSGLAMAQIGEFSFILAAVGFRNGALDFDTYRLALAVIALSLMVSPVWMVAARRFDEATTSGLTSFREALAETYSPELEEFIRGRNAVSRAAHRGQVYLKAARRAARNRSKPKSADISVDAESQQEPAKSETNSP